MDTILVVEAADAVRHFVTVALHLGYAVIAADTVAEARARFESISGRVSLLLSDVILPDGTGPELYRMLTALSPRLGCC